MTPSTGCERWVEAISALADGEDPGLDAALVDAHLRRCPDCRRFADDVGASVERGRITIADAQPDLSRGITRLNAMADRAAAGWMLRGLLAAAAAMIVALASPALLLGREGGASEHDARHIGAFSTAYAVGLAVVAVRPARARTLLPVAFFLATALVLSAAIDLVEGHARPAGELLHLPQLVSLGVLWALTRRRLD